MHSHDCSRPGLVQLRLLALHTSRFSHRFRSRRLVEEIPARPARSNQSRGVPPGWLSKNKVVLSYQLTQISTKEQVYTAALTATWIKPATNGSASTGWLLLEFAAQPTLGQFPIAQHGLL